MIIMLCGFMGAGKSTLLKSFSANSQGYTFYDLDSYLLEIKKENSVNEFVEKFGWDYFRTSEYESLIELCDKNKDSVIALGGGALNEKLLQEIEYRTNIILVYLDISFNTLWERIKDCDSRPKVKEGRDAIYTLWKTRLDLYKQAKHIIKEEELETISFTELLNRVK